MKNDSYSVWGQVTTGELIGKPLIARKIYQIPCNFLFIATFGGKNGLFSMQLAYVHEISSMKLVYVCGKKCNRARTCSKKWFFKEISSSVVWKIVQVERLMPCMHR
jgi:hypothetical protein